MPKNHVVGSFNRRNIDKVCLMVFYGTFNFTFDMEFMEQHFINWFYDLIMSFIVLLALQGLFIWEISIICIQKREFRKHSISISAENKINMIFCSQCSHTFWQILIIVYHQKSAGTSQNIILIS